MVVMIDSQVAFPDCSVSTKLNSFLPSPLVAKAITIILRMRSVPLGTNSCSFIDTTRVERRLVGTTRPILTPPAPSSGLVRTDLANRPTEPMLVSFRARYTKLWGNCGFLQSGSGQTTPVRVGVTCGSGISVVRVGRE